MKRFWAVLVAAVLLCSTLRPGLAAAGDNSFNEVAKTTVLGSAAGLVVGCAVAWLADDAEPIKWGFIGGTFAGLIYGVSHANPSSASLMELRNGHLATGGLAALDAAPGAVRVRAIGMRF